MNRHDREMQPRQDPMRKSRQQDPERQFDQLEASSLYCPTCRTAVPVRKRLLLVLPDGERYEYLCSRCFTSVGKKVEEKKAGLDLIMKP